MDLIYLLPIVAGISNALRGGQYKQWFEKYPSWISADALNAFLYAMTVLLLTSHPYLALASFGAMWLGAMPGWGDYIGAVLYIRLVNLKENTFIDPLIHWLVKYPAAWGFLGLVIRGLFWGLCLAAPFYFFGYGAVAYNFLLTGTMMPWAYMLAGFWIRTRLNITAGQASGHSWGLGEIFWGIILWSPLYQL